MSMTYIPAKDNSKISYMYDADAHGIRNGKPWKGLVIAQMSNCALDCCAKVHQYETLIGFRPWNNAANKLRMPNTFKGVAYCSVDDEFNLKTGMAIARSRMLNDYNKALLRALNSYYYYVDKLRDNIVNLQSGVIDNMHKHASNI